MWHWEGGDALLMSRAVDETGAVQPTLAELRRSHGAGARYHFNNIRAWRVGRDGRVTFGLEG
jgi:sulfane dehydrogenase subunit SoxC